MTTQAPSCSCITCSDQGIDMEVLAYDAGSGIARCADASGAESEVDAGLVDSALVGPGARLLVHAGTAIALIAAADAAVADAAQADVA